MKAAVIGTGVICEQHLVGLKRVDAARLVAVCDLSPAMASYTADRFGADATYTDYQRMLDEAKPDVVHVLTPPPTHLRIVTDCLDAGAHVFVEKPAAPTYGELEKLMDASKRTGRALVEDHNYRFNTTVQQIEKLVEEGELGTVGEVEVRMVLGIRGEGGRFADRHLRHPSHDMPAGVIHEFITHLAYLALMFVPRDTPRDFDRVSALWSNHGGGDHFRYDDLDATAIVGKTHLRIRSSCHTGPDCFVLTVRGSEGYAETDLFQPFVRVVKPRKGGKQLSPLVNQFANGMTLVNASARNFRDKIMQRSAYEGLHELVERVYDALRDGRPMPVSLDDMDSTSRLVDALVAGQETV
ncbi:Gfo/Idh/MocA family oxidoreductase [Phycisphaeraceae bacterium D3-23]